MRIVVIGAGVVGVATAHTLAREGHEVEVYDAGAEVAGEATSATAGLVAAGHSYAWASPAAPAMLARSLFGTRTAIRVRPRADADLVRWGLRFLAQCTPARFAANTRAKFALAAYSQQQMTALLAEAPLPHARTEAGVLYLHRDQRHLDRAAKQTRLLRDLGREQRILDADEVLDTEPGLSESNIKFVGAVYDPADGTGDPHRFATGLAATAATLGVQFHTGVEVSSLALRARKVVAARTSAGEVTADRFVIATGSSAPRLARTAGVRLRIYPAKGYSVSIPWYGEEALVRTGGIDEGTLVAWSPFDGELRLSATAEFVGHDTRFHERDFEAIRAAGDNLFPGELNWSKARYRAGLRPMTPDGPPYVGPSGVENLFVNAGHGHLGWTMAIGSAQLLADLMTGRSTAIPAAPYSPGR